MARGHRLNTSIVLAAVHGLSGLFRAVSEVEPSLFRPPAPPSPSSSLISHLASVDVKQNGPGIVRQGSRRDQKIKKSWRREVELDLQVGPEEIVNREVELG